MMDIGFIALGTMGSRVAANLLKAGRPRSSTRWQRILSGWVGSRHEFAE